MHPGKCQFLQQEVYFLGHIVSTHGITPDPQKTSKVKEWPWPTPTTVKEVQQFLGLANYYRRFIQDFATIAKPLHRLTESNRPFQWTKECQHSFSTLKNHLTSAPVLALPNWPRPFVLDTDASEVGIGAVLSQIHQDGTEHVIGYASRTQTKPERNYCVTQKELLAVVTFMKHFRQYLIGHHFTIRTDHGALTWLQNLKTPEAQLARWLEKLQDYQFTIVHRPDRKHNNADALSRLPCQQCGRNSHNSETSVTTIPATGLTGGYSDLEMRDLQLKDDCIGQLLLAKETDQQPLQDQAKGQSIEYRRLLQQWDQLSVRNGVLGRYCVQPSEDKGWLQLVVPRTLREEVVKEAHEGISGCH